MRDTVETLAAEASPVQERERVPAWLYGVMIVAAIGGGWTAVAVAMLPALGTESSAWLVFFLVAPFYEEALKPLGVYFVFLRWPHLDLSRIHVVLLAAAGALTFALVESWLYVDRYPDEGSDFVLFRFSVPVVMHVIAGFVFGLGLTPAVFPWLLRRASLPALTRQAYLSAVGVHMAYNVTVLILAAVGARELVEQTGT